MVRDKEILDYSERTGLSILDARKVLCRRAFARELRSDETLDDLKDTLIRVLDFEFSGYVG